MTQFNFVTFRKKKKFRKKNQWVKLLLLYMNKTFLRLITRNQSRKITPDKLLIAPTIPRTWMFYFFRFSMRESIEVDVFAVQRKGEIFHWNLKRFCLTRTRKSGINGKMLEVTMTRSWVRRSIDVRMSEILFFHVIPNWVNITTFYELW